MNVLVAAALLVASPPQQIGIDVVERLARDGWAAARAAAPQGGSPESLSGAVRILKELDAATAGTPWQVHGAYAHALIAAAMAAAEDERQEMELYLTHARDLSERLRTSKYPAAWPLEIDEAEGELYLEVDQYEDAVRAYQRAVERPKVNLTAWVGLARSAVRLGDAALACESYRRVLLTAPATAAATEATDYLKRCR